MTSCYRLHNRHGTISRGPLALVTGQAHQSARHGAEAYITDQTGNTAAVTSLNGAIEAHWMRPLELFPHPARLDAPSWLPRLATLIADLNAHTTPRPLPHTTNSAQKATP